MAGTQLGAVMRHLRRRLGPRDDGVLTDDQLLGRFLAERDEAAFAGLVRRHGPMVLGVCRRILRREHDAEDAFQATFLALVRKARSIARHESVGGWLYRVAYRAALAARVRAAKRAEREEPWVDLPAAEPAPDVVWRDLRPVLDEEVNRLPDKYRVPFVLCYLAGRTTEEAARQLGWPRGTVGTRLAWARERLRERLTRRGIALAAGMWTATLAQAAAGAKAVPMALALAAVRAATSSGALSPPVVVLADAALKTLTATKLKVAAGLLLAVSVATGTGTLVRQVGGVSPAPASPAVSASGGADATGRAPFAAQRPRTVDPEAWARKLAELKDADWRRAFAVGLELADLPAEEGFAILRNNWPKVEKAESRQQLLKAWFYTIPYPLHARNHPRLLDGLDLAVKDADPEVRQWAWGFLKEVAFEDFAGDVAAYTVWYQANRGKPVAEVVADSVRRFVKAAAAGEDESRQARLLADNWSVFRDVAEVRAAAKDAGLPAILERWITAGADRQAGPDEAARAGQALRVLAQLRMDEPYLRRVVVPLTAKDRPDLARAEAVGALRGKDNAWAFDLLLDLLKNNLAEDRPGRGVLWATAMALGDLGDPRAIPVMIGVIDADNTYDTVYGVGWFGLNRLTGVAYDASHDGAWWRRWWDDNKAKFPAEVRGREIPVLARAPKPRDAGRAAQQGADDPLADVKDVPMQDLRAGGDAQKRYLLIGAREGAREPAGGYRLLLVLPGGDGSADFSPFVRRIWKNALDERWLVAQLVAPQWDAKQFQQVVWPTEGLKYPAAKFATEDFVEAVVQDVRAKAKVDPRRVYLLGWSSGGPPCYATAARKGSPVAGAFVAMSVFRPEQLPTPAGVKGKAFYLLQSPDDKVTPLRFADAAEKALGAAGAKVRLKRYDGGHGWRGDVWGLLKEGVGWLDEAARP